MNAGHLLALTQSLRPGRFNITLGKVWVTSPTLFEPRGLREMGGVVSQKKIKVLLLKREQLGLQKQKHFLVAVTPSPQPQVQLP